MKDKEILFFKLLAVSGVLLYLYKISQKSPTGIAGNPYGVNVNAEKIAGLASQFVPREYRGHALKIGSAVIKRIIN